MTPEEKEFFKQMVKQRMEKAYKKGGLYAIVDEMQGMAKEVDEGKI